MPVIKDPVARARELEARGAVACNFRADHRVPPERSQSWQDDYLAPGDFGEAVQKYRSAAQMDAAYLEDENESNYIRGPRNCLSPKTRLVTSLDLTGLHVVFRSSGHAYLEDQQYPKAIRSDDDSAIRDWHQTRLSDPESDKARSHVAALLEALAEHVRRGGHRHPVWVSNWDRLAPLVSRKWPNGWLARLGLERWTQAGRWLILLTYTADQVPFLLRPTVLDAGTYKYHFPSPEAALLHDGGHPMNLHPSSPCGLLPEYIHPQEASMIHVDNWLQGWAGCTAEASDSDGLSQVRVQHRGLLAGAYGQSVDDWLARCGCLV